MKLKTLVKTGNVISSMVIGNYRERTFKLNGNKFLVKENLLTTEHTITNILSEMSAHSDKAGKVVDCGVCKNTKIQNGHKCNVCK